MLSHTALSLSLFMGCRAAQPSCRMVGVDTALHDRLLSSRVYSVGAWLVLCQLLRRCALSVCCVGECGGAAAAAAPILTRVCARTQRHAQDCTPGLRLRASAGVRGGGFGVSVGPRLWLDGCCLVRAVILVAWPSRLVWFVNEARRAVLPS
jgi:hypothetical protein